MAVSAAQMALSFLSAKSVVSTTRSWMIVPHLLAAARSGERGAWGGHTSGFADRN
jgi:hypothetical protein